MDFQIIKIILVIFMIKNLKIGLCGDSFSVGKVDGSIISANELSKKILGNG